MQTITASVDQASSPVAILGACAQAARILEKIGFRYEAEIKGRFYFSDQKSKLQARVDPIVLSKPSGQRPAVVCVFIPGRYPHGVL